MGRKRRLTSGKADRTRPTHVVYFPSGAKLEFRPSLIGAGWASRAWGAHGRPDNWIYFGPELPKGAVKL